MLYKFLPSVIGITFVMSRSNSPFKCIITPSESNVNTFYMSNKINKCRHISQKSDGRSDNEETVFFFIGSS